MAIPSVEPKEEQVIAAAVTTLEGIVAGADYWYTPTVIRVDHYENKNLFVSTKSPIYMVRDTSESVVAPEQRVFGKEVRVLSLFILLAYYDGRSDTNAFTMAAPLPGTIRHRMMRDVAKALYGSGNLGGQVIELGVSDPTKDFEEGVGGWLLAEVPLVVVYEHEYSEP